MGKHYDAATKERAVRMVQQAAGETGSVVRACDPSWVKRLVPWSWAL